MPLCKNGGVAMNQTCSTCVFWDPLGGEDVRLCFSEGDYTHADHLCDYWYPTPLVEVGKVPEDVPCN